MASMILCGVFAVLSGLAMAIGMNILKWAVQEKGQQQNMKEPSYPQSVHILINMTIQLMAVGFFIYACAWGPVSLAMPLETATLLLSNLALQVRLGLARFDRVCFVGTLVLTCAACSLGDIGPEGDIPAEASNETALDLLMTTPAKLWIAFIILLGAASFGMFRRSDSTFYQTLAYSLFVAIATAVGAAIGKFMTFTSSLLLGIFMVGYALCGVGSLLLGAWAARDCDLVLFMASNECFKLIITAFTGCIIWNDAPRSWVAYVMVYMLLCLGAYIVAESTPIDAELVRKETQEAAWQAIIIKALKKKQTDRYGIRRASSQRLIPRPTPSRSQRLSAPLVHMSASLHFDVTPAAERHNTSQLFMTEPGQVAGIVKKDPGEQHPEEQGAVTVKKDDGPVRHIVMVKFTKILGENDLIKIWDALEFAHSHKSAKGIKKWHCRFAADIGGAGEYRSTHSVVYQADFESKGDFENMVKEKHFQLVNKALEEYADPNSYARVTSFDNTELRQVRRIPEQTQAAA